MSKLTTPNTYLLGYTTIDNDGMYNYLKDTDQLEFLQEIEDARNRGISEGEILCSFYAKMCYASLTNKKNKNISKVRSIKDNIEGTIDSGHGSVFEHCNINFVVTNCSRVFTHEQVRHRVGAAYSQTSGRYVRNDELVLVFDPILSDVKKDIVELLDIIQDRYKTIESKLGLNDIKDFTTKKKLTSALRRILPNGQSNEIGITLNLRSLRHIIQTRTSRHAEWEIRLIFNQIFMIMKEKYPMMFHDVSGIMFDNLLEISFSNAKI